MIHTLDLPWGFKHPNVQYWKDQKVHVYKGTILPAALRQFASEDFSYSRWREDEMNAQVLPPEKGNTRFSPRPHQVEAAKKIAASYESGWRGLLLADGVGLGKTLSTLAGISSIAKSAGFGPKSKGKLLIVCPKSVIPQWRQTLHNYPVSTALLRVMIINYQQLNKLLQAPANARMAKKRHTKTKLTSQKGKPTVDWDYIVFDEAHSLKNYPKSLTSIAAANIAQLEKPYRKGETPFVVYSTATPGASPLNLALMSGFLAPLMTNMKKTAPPSAWGKFLEDEGFNVKEGKLGYTWVSVPWFSKNSDDPMEADKYRIAMADAKKKQREDSQRIGKALKRSNAPFIRRSPTDIAGWPEQQIIAYPITLTSSQRPVYEEAWTRFRNWLRLTPAKSDPKAALVEALRYRQKASLLKVDSMVDMIEGFVDSDSQVYVSCEFIETVDRYKNKLTEKGISVAEISGRNVADRENERLRFQRGEARVVLCTVVAGISLHAGEILPDGSKATMKPRISVISDVRQNNLDTDQSLGRAHRDAQNSVAYFPYIESTVEEKVIESYANKNSNMNHMTGLTETAEDMEKIFREAAARTTPPNRLS